MSPLNLLPIATQARAAGLTMIEFQALCEIWNINTVQPSRLAGLLVLSTAAVTSVIDRLADKHLVVRHPHETDRRSYWIGLSPAGDRLLQTLASAA